MVRIVSSDTTAERASADHFLCSALRGRKKGPLKGAALLDILLMDVCNRRSESDSHEATDCGKYF